MADGADEFAVIAQCFGPLASSPAARGLLDDVAVLETPGPLAITADAIVEGVHFLPDDPIESIAQKALRVNLSDLAAKGACAFAYLLTLAWPNDRPAAQIEAFAAGLAADQKTYGLDLLGGDTVSTPGPLTIAITMLGRPLGPVPSRAGARAGDDLWATGTIGDGHLGLLARLGRLATDADDAAWLIDRYRRPRPRTALAEAVSQLARAAMDISDGLIADVAKIAAASGVAIEIEAAAVPLSDPARRLVGCDWDAVSALCAGGDDYEILLAAAPEAEPARRAAAAATRIPVARIGRCAAGAGLVLRSPDGRELAQPASGFVHRLGA